MMDSDFDEIEICLKCTERGLERCICCYEEALVKIIKAAVEAGIAGYEKKKEKKNKKAGKKKPPKKKLTTTKSSATAETGKGSDEEDGATQP